MTELHATATTTELGELPDTQNQYIEIESSSDYEDDDDDIPLARRTSIPDSCSGELPRNNSLQRATSSDATSNDAGNNGKRRRIPSKAVQAAIAAEATAPQPKKRKAVQTAYVKCGKCINCLNPRRKQACEEVRKKKEAEGIPIQARKKNKPSPSPTPEPTSAAGGGGTSKAATTTKTSAAAAATSKNDDPFTASLRGILSSNGAVTQVKHINVLLDLTKRAREINQQTAIAKVLTISSLEVKEQFVQKQGLLVMQTWLSKAVEGVKNKATMHFLRCLEKLPITLVSLQSPCQLGKICGLLRKDQRMLPEVQGVAKELVALWKKIVASADDRDVAAAATAKETQKEITQAQQQQLKPLVVPKPPLPPPSAKTKATTSKPQQQQQQQPTSPKTTTTATGTKIALNDDGDMFSKADRKRAVIADPSLAKKSNLIVTEHKYTVPTTTATTGGGGNDTPTSATAAAAAKSSGSVFDDFSLSPIQPSTSFGGPGVSTFGSGSMAGSLQRLPSKKTAEERAREAAATVPDPPPEELEARRNKPNKKKLVWAGEQALQAVRWFRKTEEPMKAAQDVDFSKPPTIEEAEPEPVFASAAKKEHLSEAEALRLHRQQEDHRLVELSSRMAAMNAEIDYYDPPSFFLPTTVQPAAKGEESLEKLDADNRRANSSMNLLNTALLQGLAAGESPAEPLTVQDLGVAQDVNLLPRIPLSVEEAQHLQLWQQQQNAPQHHHHVAHYQQPPHGILHHHQQPTAATLPSDFGATLASLSGLLGSTGAPAAGGAPDYGITQHHQPHRGYQHHDSNTRSGGGGHHRHNDRHGSARPMVGLHGSQHQEQHHTYSPTDNGAVDRRRVDNRPVCRFYKSPGGCGRGDSCRFAHI